MYYKILRIQELYSIVIFIIGYYFFGKIKAYKFCSTILLLLFAFQNMVYGGRVTALQLAVVLFLFLFDGKFVPWRIIIPFGVIGIVIFVMIGSQRGGFSLSLSGMAEAIGSIFKEGASLDTAYSAYYTSLSFIKTVIQSQSQISLMSLVLLIQHSLMLLRTRPLLALKRAGHR